MFLCSFFIAYAANALFLFLLRPQYSRSAKISKLVLRSTKMYFGYAEDTPARQKQVNLFCARLNRIFALMKLTTDADYIYSLISEGEHIRQDFKFEISDARKIARSISAFANTEGGRLLIGVKDNGRIAGVRSEEEMYMIEAAAQLYCSPEVPIAMRTYCVEGKTVLVAEIPIAGHKPVMARDEQNRLWAYVRVADENILATPVHLRVWRQANEEVPVVLEYTDKERYLLNVLSAGKSYTLAGICRCTGLSRRTAESLLSRFVHWGVVSVGYDGHRFVYSAEEPPSM